MEIDQQLLDEARVFMGLPPLTRQPRAAGQMAALEDWLFGTPAAALTTTANASAPGAAAAGVSLAEIGTSLRAAREEYGLSLGELADATGMSRGRLSRLENRVTPNPTIETLARIATALGLRIVVHLRPLEESPSTATEVGH